MQSALDAETRIVVKENETVITPRSDLRTEQVSAKTLIADFNTRVAHFQRNISNLRSAQKEAVVKENQTTSNLESLKVDEHDNAKVTRLQHDRFDLLSEFGSLEREVAEDQLRSCLGITDFKQWMRESSANADTLIWDPDPSISSNDVHHVLAHNALVRVRSENWSSAYEDARKVSFRSSSLSASQLNYVSSL